MFAIPQLPWGISTFDPVAVTLPGQGPCLDTGAWHTVVLIAQSVLGEG